MVGRLKVLAAILAVAGAMQSPAAQAALHEAGMSNSARDVQATSSRDVQVLPVKKPACKKTWPYVVLICVA